MAMTGAALPVVQAPLAGFAGPELAIAAIEGGGVGSLPCAMLTAEDAVAQAEAVRRTVGAGRPLNLNFFAHKPVDAGDLSAWEAALRPFYAAEGVAPGTPPPLRRPFDAAMAEAVEAIRPTLVSFHFGLPDDDLLGRVRATGALVVGNATSAAEGRALAARGCDMIIAQGTEAGGHAGHFLDGLQPVGLVALVRLLLDAVDVPVIAAGGIADRRAAAAAMVLGAGAIQVGTAYLKTPETRALAVHRDALGTQAAERTVVTNLFSGGLARGMPNRLIDALGPVSDAAPPFPHASSLLAPLRRAAEAEGRGDYSPLWTGQAGALARESDARRLTWTLGQAALAASIWAEEQEAFG